MKKLIKLFMILSITIPLYSYDIIEDVVVFEKQEFIKLSNKIKDMQSKNESYKLQLEDLQKAIQNEREKASEVIESQKQQIDALKEVNTYTSVMLENERKYIKEIEIEKDKLVKLRKDEVKNLESKVFIERVKFLVGGVVVGILVDQIFIK